MTTTETRPSTPARYFEAVGRLTLAGSTALLGAAAAIGTFGAPGLVLAWAILTISWAVVWPERAAELWSGADRHALRAAGLVLVALAFASVLNGAPLLFLAWVGGIAATMTVLSARWYVRLPGRH